MRLSIQTETKRQVVDITDQIEQLLRPDAGGLACVTVLHTTASITTADLDPGTDLDLLDALKGLLPQRQWRHPHNPAHAPDHLISSIIGPSLMLPVRQGKLVLGTWQRVVLIELDGPRGRELEVTVVPSV
jgi:secondary thiamine-phosphate synthase enzyme